MSRNASLLNLEKPPSREEHIGRLLQSLNSQASAGSTSPHSSIPVLPLVPQVDRPLPSSDLLPRVEAFLSLIQASNDALRRQMETDPSRVDMEILDGTEDAYIEMDLGLGVFERGGSKQSGASSSSASSSENSESEDSSSNDESSSSSSDSDTDAESGEQRSMLDVAGPSTMPDIISLLTGARSARPPTHRRRQKADRKPVKEVGVAGVLSADSEEGHR